ncbi:MAG: DUF5916 domain-containing protein [Vicinamibacterales bacterium]
MVLIIMTVVWPPVAHAQAVQSGDGNGGTGEKRDAGRSGDPDITDPLALTGNPSAAPNPGVSVGVLAGRPTIQVVRTSSPPRVDGRLDDAVWRNAARITEFVQQRPLEGAPATERTDVYVAYDSQNLYFGIYAHYSDRGLIRANRVDRDQTGRDDTVRVYFDPFLDQQRAYIFSVNGYGVQGDAVLNSASWTGGSGSSGQLTPGVGTGGAQHPRSAVVNGYVGQNGSVAGDSFWQRLMRRIQPQNHEAGAGRSGLPGDSSWDALFESSGTLVEDGWTAEMAIPFKSLRYPARQQGEAHRWGFQIERTIDSKDENIVWAPISRNVMGLLRQMGVLEGMTNVSTSRNLEFLPTFTAFHSEALDTHAGNDRDHGDQNLGGQAEGAINVKYGVTPNLVFDFTYNPDFSQIESDTAQIEVNQRFPVFYPELRPFFLEGQEIYQVEAPYPMALVHTRTLVDPRYGAKLSGKVGNTSLGFLVANDEAPGRIDDRHAPAYGQAAQVVLGRVRYDLYSESYVGAIVTDREFLDGYSRVGGLDAMLRFGANHRFNFTAVNADRRDEKGVRATGSLLDFGLQREGRHLVYRVQHNQIHPEFGTDLGFVRRIDQKQTNASVGYRWWPEHWLINWEPRLQYERNYDYGGVLQDERIYGRFNFQFANNVTLYSNLGREMERYRDVDFWKTRYGIGGNVNTSRRFGVGASTWTGDQIRFIDNPFLGTDRQVNLLVNVRPFSRLESEINLSTSRFTDVRTDTRVFDVKILRTRTTYQFTNRLLVRNIIEYDTFEKRLGGNVLFTYRVNSGTVFFVGYDDHYRQGRQIDDHLFPTLSMLRTNRAIFTKLQYLFRL